MHPTASFSRDHSTTQVCRSIVTMPTKCIPLCILIEALALNKFIANIQRRSHGKCNEETHRKAPVDTFHKKHSRKPLLRNLQCDDEALHIDRMHFGKLHSCWGCCEQFEFFSESVHQFQAHVGQTGIDRTG